MLDHVFTDAIGALRDALEVALLERLATDEHLQLDMLTGDTTWETSYGLPGESEPARVRADITLDWSTWSQSAFRTWLRSEQPEEDPRIEISIVLRIQGLADVPDPVAVLAGIPARSEAIGAVHLDRTAPSIETAYSPDLAPLSHAIEFGFDGSYALDDKALTDGSLLDDHFSHMGAWIASLLVRLGDLSLRYS